MKDSQNQMITQMMTSRSQWCQNQERRVSAQSRFLRPRILLGPSGRIFPNRSCFFSARWKAGINWTLPPHKDEAFAWERTVLGDPFLQVLSFYLCLKIDPIKTWPSSYSDKSILTCGSLEALSEMSTSTPGTSISTLMTNWIFFGSWLRQKTTISFPTYLVVYHMST